MSSLPRPPEPDLKTLESQAKNYESGTQDYYEVSVKDEILAKQGMIGYLWDQWESYDISYQEVQVATGDLNRDIEEWLNGDNSWEDILEMYEDEFGHTIR